jgi:hypothetical protein
MDVCYVHVCYAQVFDEVFALSLWNYNAEGQDRPPRVTRVVKTPSIRAGGR